MEMSSNVPDTAAEDTHQTQPSPLFESDGQSDVHQIGKEPQDCINSHAAGAQQILGQSCKSFESSDENIGLCMLDRSRQREGSLDTNEALEEEDGDHFPVEGSHDVVHPAASQDCDDSTDSDLFDDDKILQRLQRSFSGPIGNGDRSSLRKQTTRNLRRKTDGALDKLNFHAVTASAADTINRSMRSINERRRSLGGRSQSECSLEAPSMGDQSFVQRWRFRMRNAMNSNYISIRRYNKKSSTIQVMENQCFVPPSNDGVTFFATLINTMRGFGVDFVIWVNQSSFLTALVLFLSSYYALVCLFAAILVRMEQKSSGKCLELGEGWTTKEMYEFSFELSWTTFTTVGYGQVSPSGYEFGCYSTRVLCASFAFLGLLFNSLSAAIFFSKLESFLTKSSVTFSSSVCLQHGRSSSSGRGGNYGQFLKKTESLVSMGSTNLKRGGKSASLLDPSNYNSAQNSTKLDTSDTDKDDKNKNLVLRAAQLSRKVPYPFLEFRIVNEHANYKKREIRHAHVAAMVQLTPADAESMMEGHTSIHSLLREYVTPAPRKQPSSDALEGMKTSTTSSMNSEGDSNAVKHFFGRADSSFAEMNVVREDSGTGQQVGPEGRVYIPLSLEPSSHPYFKRVYYVHHVLDSKSPLLKRSVRSRINDGWDPSLSTYQDIRESLVDFCRIRIIFKGNSAVNNSMVFAEKVYTLDDLFIGWQFGNIFYKRDKWRWWRWRKKAEDEENVDETGVDDDHLLLDKRLIHDIFPQKNASSEPLMNAEEEVQTSTRHPKWNN